MSFRRQMDKLIQTDKGILFSDKKKLVIGYEKTWRKLKYVLSKWKKPIWESYTLCDSNYMTSGNTENYGDRKTNNIVYEDLGKQERIHGTQKIFRQWNYMILKRWILDILCSSKPIECTPRVNANITMGFGWQGWVNVDSLTITDKHSGRGWR